MSNENAPHIFKHADDRHVQTRLDYMLIYHSESKAKIVRILETWMDTKYAESFKGVADSKEQKSEPPVEDLWITMSYDQFSLFVYGTIQHDTIKQQIDELVASKHVLRRVHPVYPYGPPQYLLNRELVQKTLDELEIPANLFDLLPSFVTPRKKRTPQEKYPQGRGKNTRGDQGKIPPGTGETSHPSKNISKNTKNYAKNGDTDNAQNLETPDCANAPAHSTSSEPDYHPDFGLHQSTAMHSGQACAAWRRLNGGGTCAEYERNRVMLAAAEQADTTSRQEARGKHGHDTGDSQRSGSGHHRPVDSADLANRASQRQNAEAQAHVPVDGQATAEGVAELSTSRASSPQRAKAKVEKATTKPANTRTQGKESATELPTFTPEGQKVSDAWGSLFKSPPAAGPKTIECANALYPRLMPWCQDLQMQCRDLLREIKDWEYATDPEYYRKRGVTLCDIGRDFERWQSAKTEAMSNPNPPEATPRSSRKTKQEKSQDSGMVEWWDQNTGEKRMMTYVEADEHGWNGGFGEYIQHTNYGRTAAV